MKGAIAFLSGFIFSLGLGLSGMTRPHIVRGFLDVLGNWDWRLMGVMIGAIGVHSIAVRFILKRSSPILSDKFQLPSQKGIDKRLIVGAVIFGLGWGWAGICPGPGIVGLASLKREFIVFTIFMLIGMKTFQLLEKNYKVREHGLRSDLPPTL